MNIIDALLAEHGLLYVLFGQIEESLSSVHSLEEVLVARNILETTLLSHARAEDTILFPVLDEHFPGMGPLHVMRADHREIDDTLEKASVAIEKNEAAETIRFALKVARNHFAKEEQVLFQMARQVLTEERLNELGGEWRKMRGLA